jgi:hypothetical protein
MTDLFERLTTTLADRYRSGRERRATTIASRHQAITCRLSDSRFAEPRVYSWSHLERWNCATTIVSRHQAFTCRLSDSRFGRDASLLVVIYPTLELRDHDCIPTSRHNHG